VDAKLGATFQRLERNEQIPACYDRAIALCESLLKRAPSSIRARLDLVAVREALAAFLVNQGSKSEVLTQLEATASDLRAFETHRGVGRPVYDHLRNLARMYDTLGENDRAQKITGWAATIDLQSPPPGLGFGPGPGDRARRVRPARLGEPPPPPGPSAH
jgi:hypothetical protein